MWQLIDQEDVPDDDGVMYLHRRGSEYVIHVDGCELMTNRLHGSEAALADLAFDLLPGLVGGRVLVGGMGMGFTLAAALARLDPTGTATVAELLPAVLRWNRDYTGEASRHPLRDPRTRVHVGSVADLIRDDAGWDAILLDVDNGPRALSRHRNGALYGRKGLQAAMRALRPRGVLGIWSMDHDDTLTQRLQDAGFRVQVIEHVEVGRPTVDTDGMHVLWMATAA